MINIQKFICRCTYIKPSELRNEIKHSLALVNLRDVILKLPIMQLVSLNTHHSLQGD